MALREGCAVDQACWSCNVDPEDFRRWIENDRSIYRRMMRETALYERELLREARKGGKTICQSRASLELLSRISLRYAPKTSVSVKTEIETLLDEFERQLDPDTFVTVLNIIETHAK
jgi:uncharacterized membrane protein